MTNMNELITLLPLLAAWIGTADGTNALFALLCAGGLIGLPARLCIGATLLLHLALILI
jgi:hypothetical protein